MLCRLCEHVGRACDLGDSKVTVGHKRHLTAPFLVFFSSLNDEVHECCVHVFIPYVCEGKKCVEEPKNNVERVRKNNLSLEAYGVSDISLVFVSPAPQSTSPDKILVVDNIYYHWCY